MNLPPTPQPVTNEHAAPPVANDPTQADTQTAPGPLTALTYRDFSLLTKPRITLMVAITATIGYAIAAAKRDENPDIFSTALTPGNEKLWVPYLAMMAGTALACMGASALNQFVERDSDALMNRTKNRPLPAGRLDPFMALLVGVTLSITGVTLLRVLTTPTAALLAAATIAWYVLLYTPLKRRTWLNTWVGTVPGATPPVIGYAAVSNTVGTEALVLLLLMILWQIPHFYAIAWIYRDQYAEAGYQMITAPTHDPTGKRTFRQAILTALALIPVAACPYFLGFAGPIYLAGSLIAGLLFLILSTLAYHRLNKRTARQLFFFSLIYLPLVLALLVIDAR